MSFGFERGRLQLWLFGPSTGELVVLHVPPRSWLVVDGIAQGESWAVRFFEQLHSDAPATHIGPTHILLSHPHTDHAGGLAELIDWSFARGYSPRLAAIPKPRVRRINRDDLVRSVGSGQALVALNAISRWWKERPSTRWDVVAGRDIRLRPGSFRFLSPATSVVKQAVKRAMRGGRVAWNDLATALLVRWSGSVVVLGSDLTAPQWPAALRRAPQRLQFHALKVAHHGSVGAQSPQLLARYSARAHFLCTPFAPEDLPRFEDHEGAHVLLEAVEHLHLTGLPQAAQAQASRPRRFTRADLAAGHGSEAADDGPRDFPSAWVKLTVDARGRGSFSHGPGSVIVDR